MGTDTAVAFGDGRTDSDVSVSDGKRRRGVV